MRDYSNQTHWRGISGLTLGPRPPSQQDYLRAGTVHLLSHIAAAFSGDAGKVRAPPGP